PGGVVERAEGDRVSANGAACVCGVRVSGPAVSVCAVRVMDEHLYAAAGGPTKAIGPDTADELSVQRALVSGGRALGAAGTAAGAGEVDLRVRSVMWAGACAHDFAVAADVGGGARLCGSDAGVAGGVHGVLCAVFCVGR